MYEYLYMECVRTIRTWQSVYSLKIQLHAQAYIPLMREISVYFSTNIFNTWGGFTKNFIAISDPLWFV